jgi:hypothetical protein
MSLVHHEVSAKQVAANQANAQKSTGPKTLAGKVRASLNSFKHGAYAKIDSRRRQVLLRHGQDPGEYEELHQELVDSWQPDDAMQVMVVKTIADRTWDKLQLRRAWLDAQWGTLESAQTQAQRRQLAARRWFRGTPLNLYHRLGLCGSTDSPDKFKQILESLEYLREWFENETCPDEYPGLMSRLYGDFPTVAGQRIKELFRQLFDDDQAVCEKARQELPKWIGQEKSDTEQDRDLYRRELTLKAMSRTPLPEDQVGTREAALDRQIAEQTRLLLQLKSKRYLWGSESETGEGNAGTGPCSKPEASVSGNDAAESKNEGPLSSTGTASEAQGTGSTNGASLEKSGQKGQTEPSDHLESAA